MLSGEEIKNIVKSIVKGVDDARDQGVACDYPENMTVEMCDSDKTVTAVYPIQLGKQLGKKTHQKIESEFCLEDQIELENQIDKVLCDFADTIDPQGANDGDYKTAIANLVEMLLPAQRTDDKSCDQ